MTLWKTAALAAGLGMAAPQSALADGSFVHVSPSLALAEPCGANDGCAFSWTLATRFGVALNFAEQRYGKRDLNWTLLGVDFANIPRPQIFYAGAYSGRQDVVIQLTAAAARDEKQALFQLGHEVMHVLSPIGPTVTASVLEEGIATYNSIEFVRDAGIDIEPDYIGEAAYEAAYWMIVELAQAQPDFVARTATLRRLSGRLSGLSATTIRRAYPSISADLARRLASDFRL